MAEELLEGEHEMLDGSALKRQHDQLLHERFNAAGYGAALDGITDDTNALRAIAGEINAAGGGELFIGKGTALITAGLTFTVPYRVRGVSPNVSTIKVKAGTYAGFNIITTSGTVGDVADLRIDGNRSNVTGTIHAIRASGAVGPGWVRNCRIQEMTGTGVSVPAGTSCSALWILDNSIQNCNSNCIHMDSGAADSYILNNDVGGAAISGTSTILLNGSNDILVQGNKAYSAGTYGYDVFGCTHISLIGNRAEFCNSDGIRIEGEATHAVSCIGNECHGNGQVTAGSAGIRVDSFTSSDSSVQVANNICGDNQGSPTQAYGIRLGRDNTVDYVDVLDNDVSTGNVTAGLVQFNVGTHLNIRGNRGYNPQGVAAITVTASPFTYTNNDNVPELIYVSGGTISAMAKDSITLFGVAGDASIWLEPGEAVTITYAVAPTMNKDRK